MPPAHYQGMTTVESPVKYPATELVCSPPVQVQEESPVQYPATELYIVQCKDKSLEELIMSLIVLIGIVTGIVLLGVGISKAASATDLNAAEDFIELNFTCEVTAENYYYARNSKSRTENHLTVYDISCDDCYKWEGIRNVSDVLYSPALTEPLRFYNQCNTRKSVIGARCNEPHFNRYSDLCEECPAGSPLRGSFEVGDIVQCWIAKSPRAVPADYVCQNSLCT